jgi:hypothetical protein
MRYNVGMDKEKFDDLTDLVEHAQDAKLEQENPATQSRQVENAQGEKITLDDKKHPDIF